jgi:hypothetical protein
MRAGGAADDGLIRHGEVNRLESGCHAPMLWELSDPVLLMLAKR